MWWDLTDFFEAEKTEDGYNWETPTMIYNLGEPEIDYETNEYFKEIEIEGIKTKIIDKPRLHNTFAGNVIYFSIIVMENGNIYKAYWNLFNIFEPCKIELSVDNSKQCKYCLKPWRLNEGKCVNEDGHEYISNK